MWKVCAVVVFTASLVLTTLGSPETILTSLKNDFQYAKLDAGDGTQFGVLYLHKGDHKTDAEPAYDAYGLCKSSFKDQINEWAGRRAAPRTAMKLNPPVWPTDNIIKTDCGGKYTNIAAAGRDTSAKTRTKPTTGHSEFLLLQRLDEMLGDFQERRKQVCPSAVFLYSYNTPCGGCAKNILGRRQDMFSGPCKKTPFIIGYTKVYNGDNTAWTNVQRELRGGSFTFQQVS